jgi:malate synthase
VSPQKKRSEEEEEARRLRRLEALEALREAAELRARLRPRRQQLARARALLQARTTRG